jgi:predicted nuclease with TOPRIM domain
MEKYEEIHSERAALAEQLDVMESSYAEERLKLEATKAQQTKLIDFLQYKTEGQSLKKKKVWIFNDTVMKIFYNLIKSKKSSTGCYKAHWDISEICYIRTYYYC